MGRARLGDRMLRVVVAVLLSIPLTAAADEGPPALIDFIAAWTNDDGAVDGADAGDVGESDAEYDRWLGASSVDPAGPGLDAARTRKDVARCTASIEPDPDYVTVVIDNAYPAYTCTFFATIENRSGTPATVHVRTIEADAPVTLTEISGLPVGTTIPPGGSADVVYAATLEQEAEQEARYEFRITHVVGGGIIDLELEIVADPFPIDDPPRVAFRPGEAIGFTVYLVNRGPDPATGIEVDVAVSEAILQFDGAVPAVGTFSGRTWSLDSLAVGEQQTLRLLTTALTAGIGSADAEVMAANEEDVDSTPANYDGTNPEDDWDVASVPIAEVRASIIDLALTKTVDPVGPVEIGGTASFTLTVTHEVIPAPPPGYEQVAASGVQVTDYLPAGLTFLAAHPQAGTSFAGSVWDVGFLDIGESRTLVIDVTVDGEGPFLNTAEVTRAAPTDDIDSTPANGVVTEDDWAQAPINALPYTGLEAGRLSGIGAALVAAGILMVAAAGRRRSSLRSVK